MKTIGRAAIGFTVAAATVIMIAPGAYAINRTPCNNRTDFFTIFNNNFSGELCFANDGDIGVAIFNVDQVDTGNNTAFYDIGGATAFQRSFVDVSYGGNPEITDIDIVGR